MGLYLTKESYSNYAVAHAVYSDKLELLHLKAMEPHQFAQEELAKYVLVTLHSEKTMFIIESNTKCS